VKDDCAAVHRRAAKKPPGWRCKLPSGEPWLPWLLLGAVLRRDEMKMKWLGFWGAPAVWAGFVIVKSAPGHQIWMNGTECSG
jgi:hypothetical protein